MVGSYNESDQKFIRLTVDVDVGRGAEVEVVGRALPEEAKKVMEWEREQGAVMGVDVDAGAKGLLEGVQEGDTIEVKTPEGHDGLSTARNTRSKTPEPSSASPVKRGPGRPKKKA